MPFAIDIHGKEHIQRLPLDRAQKALAERTEWLEAVLREAGPELDAKAVRTVQLEDGAELSGLVRRVSDELEALTDRVQELRKQEAVLEKARAEAARVLPAPAAGDAPAYRSLADVARKTGALAAMKELRAASAVVEDADPAALILGKATMTTSAGIAPETARTGQVAFAAVQPPRIIDIIPAYPTGQAAVVYLEETTFTNAAAERAEAAVYAEAALAYTERNVPVRSIGVSLPVTDEQREDVAGVEALIDGRLRTMLQLRLDSQLLNGNGTAPNLLGTLNVTGIQTQARATDPHPDAILKAMTKVRTTGAAEPSAVILNPSDWQTVRLAKTTDGAYLFGPPYDAGIPRIWGVPVVASSALAQGTGIVGDYAAHAGLFLRAGIEVQVALSNDDFVKGKVTFRAGMRAAVVHFRPAAFCTVTGL